MESEVLKTGSSELSILLCDDREIHRLNKEYRGKDKPTDVLSFPAHDEFVESVSLGDIVISLETAAQQAKSNNISLEEEVTRLLVHSVLHLLGYDHENVSRAEAERMRKAEERVLRQIDG